MYDKEWREVGQDRSRRVHPASRVLQRHDFEFGPDSKQGPIATAGDCTMLINRPRGIILMLPKHVQRWTMKYQLLCYRSVIIIILTIQPLQ